MLDTSVIAPPLLFLPPVFPICPFHTHPHPHTGLHTLSHKQRCSEGQGQHAGGQNAWEVKEIRRDKNSDGQKTASNLADDPRLVGLFYDKLTATPQSQSAQNHHVNSVWAGLPEGKKNLLVKEAEFTERLHLPDALKSLQWWIALSLTFVPPTSSACSGFGPKRTEIAWADPSARDNLTGPGGRVDQQTFDEGKGALRWEKLSDLMRDAKKKRKRLFKVQKQNEAQWDFSAGLVQLGRLLSRLRSANGWLELTQTIKITSKSKDLKFEVKNKNPTERVWSVSITH